MTILSLHELFWMWTGGHVTHACTEKTGDVAAEDGGVIVEEQVRDNAIKEHVSEQVNDTEMKETDGGEGEDLSAESSTVVEAAETVLEEEGMDSEFGNEEEIFKTPFTKSKIKNERCIWKKIMLWFELIKQKNIDATYIHTGNSDCINATDWKTEWEGEHIWALIEVVGLLFSKSVLPVSYQVEEVIAGRLIIIRAELKK